MLLLHHGRNLTPAAYGKGVNIRTSNFLQAFSLHLNGAHKKKGIWSDKQTWWWLQENSFLFLFSKQFLQFFSAALLHNLAEWRCIMPPAHSRILMSIDVLCSLFFLRYPRVVCLRWTFSFSSPPKSGINNNIKLGNYAKTKVGVGWSLSAFDKCLGYF